MFSVQSISPCDTADSCDWHDDDINSPRALVDSGAMVTCAGQQHITHSCMPHSKLQPCQIHLKAALDTNKSAHACLRCRSADGQGCHDDHVHCHLGMNGALLGPTGMFNLARKSNQNFTGQTMHGWFSAHWKHVDHMPPQAVQSQKCHHLRTPPWWTVMCSPSDPA